MNCRSCKSELISVSIGENDTYLTCQNEDCNAYSVALKGEAYITAIFEREARHLCERQSIAYHDWQKSERRADTVFVRGVQANGERVEIWSLEFRPTLALATNGEGDPIELSRADCVMVASVGYETPDVIVEETHAYNRWGERGPEWYKSNEDYNG